MFVNAIFFTHFGESTLHHVLLRSQPIFNFVEPCQQGWSQAPDVDVIILLVPKICKELQLFR